jgi:DNA-binding transcriptional MerR regulator
MADIKIGDLAEKTGTNPPTIRYYEEIGLLPPASRRPGGQRSYGGEDVKRLVFIRRCRDFGFPIEQVRSLLALMQDRARSCMEARDMAQAHLAAVRAKLVELKALERSVADFVRSCEASCAGGPGPDCVILEDLAAPNGASRLRKTPHSQRRSGSQRTARRDLKSRA